MKKRTKVLLIGWDAADWKVINPLLDAGLMPNLEGMINQGTIGNLASMDPAYSPMLWSSIATGKRAYKHGVLGFVEPTPDGKDVRPVMSISRKVKAIWNMLSEKDYKTNVVGWWPSHPAEPINGISISNFYQKDVGLLKDPWPMADGTVYPKELSKRFEELRVHPEELTGQHILPFIPQAEKINQKENKNIYTVAKITAHAASIQAAATNILRTTDWDFTAVYFDAIDHYCHGFMKYHPPKREHVSQHQFDLLNHVVSAGYRYHDMLLGRLLELAGEETTVMLISDHGFQPDNLRPKYVPREPAGAAYEHSPYGIICMKGPGIKKDHLVHGAKLLDITPTLLHAFGLPIGKDMDGRILHDVFEKSEAPILIDSWENENPLVHNEGFTFESDSAQDEMIQQLVDLGYINPLEDNKEKRVIATTNDCQFNLARSYMDADMLKEACETLEPLVANNIMVPRFTYFLASAYQSLGRLSDCRKMINRLRKLQSYKPYALDIMEGALLMGENKYVEALILFQKVEKELKDDHAHLHLKIAQCYAILGHTDKALEAVEKELEKDFDFALAHLLQGRLFYKQDKFEQCCQSVLRAISLDYRMENSHFYLGLSLFHLGKYPEAAEALEVTITLMPTNNVARNKLIELYQIHLNEPQKAAEHRTLINNNLGELVYVVSGLPRSGTSMMMQMLKAGGLELFTDGKRDADENNLKGYFEHEIVKSLSTNKKWLMDAEGKVVKIVANHLMSLPANRKYKIIFLDRAIQEVMSSQLTMLENLGKRKSEVYSLQIAQSLESSRNQTLEWLKTQVNIDLLVVEYAKVVATPFAEALRIIDFLELPMEAEKIIQVIDPKLYRSKTNSSLINNPLV